MSKKHVQMAAERKANQKARMVPLHTNQVDVRKAERVERAANWAKKKAKKG